MAATSCSGQEGARPSHVSTPANATTPAGASRSANVSMSATSRSAAITVAPADRAACGVLYGRLQQVSTLIGASSELLANSEDPQQLAQHIGEEQAQLEQAAGLMAAGPVPAPLAAVVQQLASALHAFSADFGRAKEPAAQGDFAAAVTAMNDKAVVQRIVDASTAIEQACG